jgi:hypothetical protein
VLNKRPFFLFFFLYLVLDYNVGIPTAAELVPGWVLPCCRAVRSATIEGSANAGASRPQPAAPEDMDSRSAGCEASDGHYACAGTAASPAGCALRSAEPVLYTTNYYYVITAKG